MDLLLEPTIEQYMTQQPQSIDAGETVQKARDTMTKFGIRHLPVIRDGLLAGVVSDRELNLGSEIRSSRLKGLSVIDVCSEDPYIVSPETPLRAVVNTMVDRQIGSAIVAEGGIPVGIFTTVDACRVLSQMFEAVYVKERVRNIRQSG